MVQRVLKMILDLTLSTMSAEGQGYPKVTKLGSSSPWLVTLEKVAASFSHFIIEHWVPTQAILIDLHNSTCPSCQRVDGMADNGVRPPSPSDLVRLLQSQSLRQTLDREKPLPSLVLSPPSSPTLPPA